MKPPLVWRELSRKGYSAVDVPMGFDSKTDMCLTIWKAFSILAQKKQDLCCCIEPCCDVHFMLTIRAV
jgi:hypothetical protein